MNNKKFDNLKKYYMKNYDFFIDIDLTLFKTMKDIENIIKELDLKIDSFQKDLSKAAATSDYNNNIKNHEIIVKTRKTGF